MTSAHFYVTKDGIYAYPDGSLIMDGAITAHRITANTVTTPKPLPEGWKPLGYVDPNRIATSFHKSPEIKGGLPWREIRKDTITLEGLKLSQEALELYYGVPQRFIAGIDPATTTFQESPLSETFTNNAGASITVDSNGIYPMIKANPNYGTFAVLRDRDLPKFLKAVINGSTQFGRKVKHVTLDGKPSIKAGEGGSAGIVYKPTTQDQADRNLNFALANLEASIWWETTGKAEAEIKAKRDAELKAAQERVTKLREENLRRVEKEEADGIAAYNKSKGTSYRKFSEIMFMGSVMKSEWIEIGKQQAQLKQEKEQVRKERMQNEINRAVINPLRPSYVDPYTRIATRPWL